ncbi:Uncharacterised protein [Acholeplasma oculi]|uniref:Uncharacterized protein n=1 Tax=Acholeplasma oculi TaxID=35623 RepID=A0A061AFM7_9MOLU|nr:hypothetical protein [Acholeplasma oculi]CDR30361.1 hypothetical protein Aocu_02880 [Acholeplasma oculi]SKC42306.1 hypothetical protein SAMN02745122_0883 [Acholeplasma oculi]SUT88870.1 Uncharacterised protein [Acholeplasma oculi]
MLINEFIKPIKDKKLRALYQILIEHLSFIKNIETMDLLKQTEKDVLAFLNGYTNEHKSYKQLRKSFKEYPLIHLKLLYSFIQYKVNYLSNPMIRSLDNYYKYAHEQSIIGFTLYILNNQPKEHYESIMTLSRIDVCSDLLLNADLYLQKGLIHFPKQFIDDYGISLDLNGYFLKNTAYIQMYEYLFFKIKQDIEKLNIYLELIYPDLKEIFTNYLTQLVHTLTQLRDKYLSKIKS